jgi:sulfocyanin
MMKRFATLSLVVALAACSGGKSSSNEASASQPDTQPATQPEAQATQAAAPSGPMTMPDWYKKDDATKTVSLDITAGATDANNHWNFNGGTHGDIAITVPEGYTVKIDFQNHDPAMAHSMGIVAQTSGFGAAMTPTPAFPGAITSNPTSMTAATLPGKSEDVTFKADKAGNYAMVCFIPGHAATGMYLLFNVSSDGSAGVQTSM